MKKVILCLFLLSLNVNAYQLRELVKARIPGYDDSEYLRELNEAYRVTTGEIIKLDEDYYTWPSILQVNNPNAASATDFDLISNSFSTYTLPSETPVQLNFGRAYSASTSAYAGTVVDDPQFGAVAWTNPQNAQGAPDQQYATAALNTNNTHILKATNFNLSVPLSATILGIRADVTLHFVIGTGAPAFFLNGIYKAGALIGGVPSATQLSTQGTSIQFGANDTTWTWGGANDLGGNIISGVPAVLGPADVNGSGFGFGLVLNGPGGTITFSVDAVKLTIYYSVPPYNGVHPYFYKIKRARVQPPNSQQWVPARLVDWNSDEYLTDSQASVNPTPAQVGPFRYVVYGKNFLRFARPLPNGALIEMVYSYSRVPLQIISGGNIASSDGVNINGQGTNFTQIIPQNVQPLLPTTDVFHPLSLESEIGFGTAPSLFFPVPKYVSDTNLVSPGVPNLGMNSSSPYFLSNVPDMPFEHHGVLATMATERMFSTPGKDLEQLKYWKGEREQEWARMLDELQKRDSQNNPRKARFPMRQARRGFGVI